MGTLACFHAHPDDEAIQTGGTMARAVSEGHRVILVVATNGEYGEVPEDLQPGETLAGRRRVETERSAAALGIHEVVWLGYADSGMTGWEQNHLPGAFMSAPLDEAAGRLAQVLTERSVDVLTVYDWHGGYGHPDHIQVHRVGHRAAELIGRDDLRVFEATMNRTRIFELMKEAAEVGEAPPGRDGEGDFDPDSPADDGNPFGSLESEITLQVDVSAFVDAKRAAIRAHTSQVSDSSFFLQMSEDVFARAFGTEWFIEAGVTPSGPQLGFVFD